MRSTRNCGGSSIDCVFIAARTRRRMFRGTSRNSAELLLRSPRGKQDWQPEPHAIWYARTTGIWQTVWLERLRASWIDSLRWTPGVTSWDIACEAAIGGSERDDLTPVYSFNGNGLWLARERSAGRSAATGNVNLWNEMNARMGKEFE